MRSKISYQKKVVAALRFLKNIIPDKIKIIIQTGTGLANLAKAMDKPVIIPYRDIPHFPFSTVKSHPGNLVYGSLAGKPVALLQGRFHYYEGYSTREVTFPIRVLSLLGADTAIITNASGGLNIAYKPGTIMIITDHIYLLPDNPLRGVNVESWGERFPDMSCPYDKTLNNHAVNTAAQLNIDELVCGTYVCVAGPSLETVAETRYLKMIGADAVGMSSIPEVIVAVHGGMRVLGLSVVANVNDPDNFTPILLEDIIDAAGQAEPRLKNLILGILSRI